MVINGLVITRLDCTSMVPPVRKTTILGPSVSMAARKLPGPLSFRLVTSINLPPRPPTELAPNPSAPGKARAGEVGVALSPTSGSTVGDVLAIWAGVASERQLAPRINTPRTSPTSHRFRFTCFISVSFE